MLILLIMLRVNVILSVGCDMGIKHKLINIFSLKNIVCTFISTLIIIIGLIACIGLSNFIFDDAIIITSKQLFTLAEFSCFVFFVYLIEDTDPNEQ